jgi:hypothetical protein
MPAQRTSRADRKRESCRCFESFNRRCASGKSHPRCLGIIHLRSSCGVSLHCTSCPLRSHLATHASRTFPSLPDKSITRSSIECRCQVRRTGLYFGFSARNHEPYFVVSSHPVLVSESLFPSCLYPILLVLVSSRVVGFSHSPSHIPPHSTSADDYASLGPLLSSARHLMR